MIEYWNYRCGELCDRMATRVFRRRDGLIGKVVRTYGGMMGHADSRAKHRVVTRYFVWALPDDSPEYATEAEAEQAAEGVAS